MADWNGTRLPGHSQAWLHAELSHTTGRIPFELAQMRRTRRRQKPPLRLGNECTPQTVWLNQRGLRKFPSLVSFRSSQKWNSITLSAKGGGLGTLEALSTTPATMTPMMMEYPHGWPKAGPFRLASTFLEGKTLLFVSSRPPAWECVCGWPWSVKCRVFVCVYVHAWPVSGSLRADKNSRLGSIHHVPPLISMCVTVTKQSPEPCCHPIGCDRPK